MTTNIQATADQLLGFDCAPASYGFVRSSAMALICPLIEQHLLFWYDKDGGTDTDDGKHWIWKSAEELRRWLESTHRIVVSGPTVARALAALVDSGRWVRQQLGQMRRSFYYRPADECIDQLRQMHFSMARNPAETSSETPSPEGRCAFSEPVDPGSESHPINRDKPVRRRDRPDPTRYQSQAATLHQVTDWEREYLQTAYAHLQPQEAQEQPAANESPTEPVEQPLRLDSQPSQAPGQSEAGIVTDEDCAAACDAFNKAGKRGWVWDSVTRLFRNRWVPGRTLAVEAAATEWRIDPALLRLVVGHG